jgi:hypothetical protein
MEPINAEKKPFRRKKSSFAISASVSTTGSPSQTFCHNTALLVQNMNMVVVSFQCIQHTLTRIIYLTLTLTLSLSLSFSPSLSLSLSLNFHSCFGLSNLLYTIRKWLSKPLSTISNEFYWINWRHFLCNFVVKIHSLWKLWRKNSQFL